MGGHGIPATLDSDVVIIDDAIVSVDRAVWEGLTESHSEFGGRWREKKRSSLESMVDDVWRDHCGHRVAGRGMCVLTSAMIEAE